MGRSTAGRLLLTLFGLLLFFLLHLDMLCGDLVCVSVSAVSLAVFALTFVFSVTMNAYVACFFLHFILMFWCEDVLRSRSLGLTISSDVEPFL